MARAAPAQARPHPPGPSRAKRLTMAAARERACPAMVAGYALAGPVYIRVCVRVRLGNNGPRPCAPLLIRLGRLITNISLATVTYN